MVKEKKDTSAKKTLTMAEAHARRGEIKPQSRIEAKVNGKPVPAAGKGSVAKKGDR